MDGSCSLSTGCLQTPKFKRGSIASRRYRSASGAVATSIEKSTTLSVQLASASSSYRRATFLGRGRCPSLTRELQAQPERRFVLHGMVLLVTSGPFKNRVSRQVRPLMKERRSNIGQRCSQPWLRAWIHSDGSFLLHGCRSTKVARNGYDRGVDNINDADVAGPPIVYAWVFRAREEALEDLIERRRKCNRPGFRQRRQAYALGADNDRNTQFGVPKRRDRSKRLVRFLPEGSDRRFLAELGSRLSRA
jgi:hypothetical protein